MEKGCSGFFFYLFTFPGTQLSQGLVSFSCNPVASVVILLLCHRNVEVFEGFIKQLKLPALKYWNKTSCPAGWRCCDSTEWWGICEERSAGIGL